MQIPAFLDPRDLLIWINERPFIQGMAQTLTRDSRRFIDLDTTRRVRKAFFTIINNAYMHNEAETIELKRMVDEFGAPAIRLLIVLWHEQRHFLDHILTNYGASKVRFGFMIRSQLHSLLQGAVVNREIALPLRAYRDPLRLKLLDMATNGVHPLAGFATSLADRVEMDRDDFLDGLALANNLTSFRLTSGRPVALSGFNMLEALATIAQSEVLQTSLIMPPGDRKWTELGNAYTRFPYLAAFGDCLEGAGIKVLDGHIDQKTRTAVLAVKPTVLAATLIASLMCRRTKPIAEDFDESAYSPTERFAHIREEISRTKATDIVDPDEAFEFVNGICKRIWKRSIIEDFKEDIEFTEREADRFSRANSAGDINVSFLRSYILMRQEVMSDFEKSPGSYFCGRGYVRDVAPRTIPKIVFVDSGSDGLLVFGTNEQLNSGTELVDGLEDKFDILSAQVTQLGDNAVFAKVYCYCPRHTHTGSVLKAGLPTTYAAHAVQTAGLVRLLLSGRTEAVGVDVLLYEAEKRLREAGIGIKFERGQQYPVIERDPSYLFEMFELEQMTCDITEEKVTRWESAIVSPWEFDRFPKLLEAARAKQKQLLSPLLGEDDQGASLGDWNPWLVKKELLES